MMTRLMWLQAPQHILSLSEAEEGDFLGALLSALQGLQSTHEKVGHEEGSC
jgi:hypothetical protein